MKKANKKGTVKSKQVKAKSAKRTSNLKTKLSSKKQTNESQNQFHNVNHSAKKEANKQIIIASISVFLIIALSLLMLNMDQFAGKAIEGITISTCSESSACFTYGSEPFTEANLTANQTFMVNVSINISEGQNFSGIHMNLSYQVSSLELVSYSSLLTCTDETLCGYTFTNDSSTGEINYYYLNLNSTHLEEAGTGLVDIFSLEFNNTGETSALNFNSVEVIAADSSGTVVANSWQVAILNTVVEGCSESDQVTCYYDGDSDGYGNGTRTKTGSCVCDGFWVENNTDCDDGNDSAYALNSSGVCGDGLDTIDASMVTTITECNYVVSSPGSYTLENNLLGCNYTGININANDVDLDCSGYYLSGNYSDGLDSSSASNAGIVYYVKDNISISNCGVFNFTIGVLGSNSNNLTISNLSFQDNGVGIWVQESNVTLFNDNYGNQNSVGAVLNSVNGGIFSNNSFYDNTYDLQTNMSSFEGSDNCFDVVELVGGDWPEFDVDYGTCSIGPCGGYTCGDGEVCVYEDSLCTIDSDNDDIGMIEDICRFNETNSFCNNILFYSFDEGEGSTLYDLSGNANAGTSHNAVWSEDSFTDYLASVYGGFNTSLVYSLDFSADDAYLTASAVNPTEYLTLDILLKINNLTAGTILENYNADGSLSYKLDLVDSSDGHVFIFSLQDTNGNMFSVNSSEYSSHLNVDGWYLINVIYDSNDGLLKMYVSNESLSDLVLDTDAGQVNSGTSFVVGAGFLQGTSTPSSFVNSSNVTIDSIKIYDKVLIPCATYECPDSYYCEEFPDSLSLCQFNESYVRVEDPDMGLSFCTPPYSNEDSDGFCSDVDCDDNDDTIGSSYSIYEDTDSDGYNSSTATTFDCSVTGPLADPISFYAYSTTAGTDCNDSDSSVYQSKNLYNDTDGDGYNSSTYTTMCVGTTVPEGYTETPGTDCDDTNSSIHTSQTLYADSDGDGFYSKTSTTVCSNGTTPGTYSASTGTDCNDADSSINTNATESCSDGADNDCNGAIDCDDSACTGDSYCATLSTQPTDNTTTGDTVDTPTTSSGGSGGRGASCQEDWSCGTWSYCGSDLTQTRGCYDNNQCGTEDDKPNETQSCDACEESWICKSWSECSSSNKQSRDCYDERDCGTYSHKPDTSKSCDEEVVDDSSYVTTDDSSDSSSNSNSEGTSSSSSSSTSTSSDNQDTYTEPPVAETLEPEVQETSSVMGYMFIWQKFKYFIIIIPTVLLLIMLVVMVVLHRAHDKKPAVNHDQLDNYIKLEMEAGLSQEIIKNNLKASGWNDNEIADGLSRANGPLKQ